MEERSSLNINLFEQDLDFGNEIRLEADETSLWIRSLRPNELSAKGNTPPSA